MRDNRIVPGGGAAEIAASIATEAAADTVGTVEQYSVRAFADALMVIPEALADNSGLNAITCTTEIKARQISEKNPNLGVDCMKEGTSNMLDQNIWECLISKENQLALATQVGKRKKKLFHVARCFALSNDSLFLSGIGLC